MSTTLLTTGEVGRRFGVSPRTVWRWIQAGKLPAIRTPGGHARVHVEYVEQLMRELAR